ncbi:MAG: hypothetical protein HY537_06635 [Deltaproteobacteria bacterium]|nr:hypothetical protein [Deltaproteobacteria bacterium]
MRLVVYSWVAFCVLTSLYAVQEGEGLLNKLITPGPLMEGHRDLESSQCLKCHGLGKGLPDSKCLECHKEIGERLSAKRSYHGLVKKPCISCHSDHKGRDYDSTEVIAGRFDHASTGFVLSGKHEKLECNKCHLEKRTQKRTRKTDLRYLGATTSCTGCHKKNDVHSFMGEYAKTDCIQCHSVNSWKKDVRFEHENKIRFKLEGAHKSMACKQCHLPKGPASVRYQWSDLENNGCLACHQDYHLFGNAVSPTVGSLLKCERCHNEASWKQFKFDHNKQTQYSIDGKHDKVPCTKCHIVSSQKGGERIYHWQDLSTKTCEVCHVNPHRNSFSAPLLAKKCTDCHSTSGWKMSSAERAGFNHEQNTRFPLTGKHKALNCEKCHRSGQQQIYKFKSSDTQFCVSCHPNGHIDQFSAGFAALSCGQCHTSENFTVRRELDHDTTRYKLEGKHLKVECGKCHVPTEKRFENAPYRRKAKFLFSDLEQKNCAACHKDPHRGDFGTQCLSCHLLRGWKVTRDFHRNFLLSGVHYTLECVQCHKHERRLAGLSDWCVLCHQKDDAHNGTLPQCGNCHRQNLWENSQFRHSLTNFPLRGMHRTLDCMACHGRGIYKGASSQCIDCHLGDATAVSSPVHSMPQFQQCESCHNQFAF